MSRYASLRFDEYRYSASAQLSQLPAQNFKTDNKINKEKKWVEQ